MDAVVCGIDPGLGTTGYAVVALNGNRPRVIDAGVFRIEPTLPLARRLLDLDCEVTAVLAEHEPNLVAVEELYAHYNHPRTAILMAHARGAILLAAARLGIEVRDYGATRIKRHMTGNGRATKSQMQGAVRTALGLTDVPDPPDVADALAIAMCCLADRSCRFREVVA